MFRRKAAGQTSTVEETPEVAFDPTGGPHDVADVDLEDGTPRIDLGGLLIPPMDGAEVRIQVDQATQAVQSVLVAGPEGAVELKPFAAPRGGDLWGDIRPQIAEDITNRGGTITEREGRFGTEIVGVLPVQLEDGTQAQQPSRVAGVNGPRWLLRVTYLGRPAMEPEGETTAAWEDFVGSVVVRRGDQAMPVGDAIPLVLPPQARPE